MKINDDNRLQALMKLAAKKKIDRRFYKIDAERCQIVEVIGSDSATFPRDIMMMATPETLIRDPMTRAYCRTAVSLVHETGDPISIKLPITIKGQTNQVTVHFRRGRSSRGDDRNTVIAYSDWDTELREHVETYGNDYM